MSIWYHCPSLQAPEMKPSSLDWSFSSHLFRSQLTILGRKPHNFYVVYVVNSETSEGIAKGTHDLLPSRSMVSTRSFRNPQKGQVMTEKPRFLSKTEAFKNPSTSRILHNWKKWWCCDLLWNIPSCRTTDPQHPQLFFSPWCSQLHANRHMIPAVTVAARAISPVRAPRLGGFSCR